MEASRLPAIAMSNSIPLPSIKFKSAKDFGIFGRLLKR